MNKIIKELADMAVVVVNNPLLNSAGEVVIDDHRKVFDIEKFANLVVKECLLEIGDLMDYTEYNDPVSREVELKTLRYVQTCLKQRFDIK
jgi:hypothetical protein